MTFEEAVAELRAGDMPYGQFHRLLMGWEFDESESTPEDRDALVALAAAEGKMPAGQARRLRRAIETGEPFSRGQGRLPGQP